MKSAFPTILAGGLTAGTLDITYACVFWGLKADVPVQRIFQSVASGLLGKDSFEGGIATALLGLALHMGIATAMAGFYYLIASRWSWLRNRPLIGGCGYGVFLYLFMNFVVLPLSAASPGSKNLLWIWLSVLGHMVLVGAPIAFFTSKGLGRD